MHGSLADDAAASCGCVLYLDVDHMHIVNELHGFEIGNELIVRVADLLARRRCRRMPWRRGLLATGSSSCCRG